MPLTHHPSWLPHLFIDHQVNTITAGGVDIVLQRRGPVVCVHHVTRLLVEVRDPLGKLATQAQVT